MRVVVSWTDASSRLLAEALAGWLTTVLPEATATIVDGRARDPVEADAALVCVTRTALDANWLFFALGALRSRLGTGAIVAPVLLDVAPEEISPTPLHLFQATRVAREDMLGLVRDLNDLADRSLSGQPLSGQPLSDRSLFDQSLFDRSWEAFHRSSRRIPGYELRNFVVTVKLPARTFSFTFKASREADWDETVGAFIRSLSRPGSPLHAPPFDLGTFHFLDVTSAAWAEQPAVLSRLTVAHVAFIDPAFVEEWRGNSRLAAAVIRDAAGSKRPEWTVMQTGEKLAIMRGIR
jgi:hypothetical protein